MSRGRRSRTRLRPYWWVALAASLAGVLGVVLTTDGDTVSAAPRLIEDFEDGVPSGWAKSGGDWQVVQDSGSQVLRQSKLSSELARQFAGDPGWTDYRVRARVKPLDFGGATSFVALGTHSTSATRMYRLALYRDRAELQAVSGSRIKVIGSRPLSVRTGTWYTLSIVTKGEAISASVDGQSVASGTDSTWGKGRIALVTSFATACFDDVVVSEDGPAAPAEPTEPPAEPAKRPTKPTERPTEPAKRPTKPTERPTEPRRPPTEPSAPGDALVGWASKNGGTTGGADGPTVTVTSGSQLVNAMRAAGPRIIQVSGTLALSGMNDITSDKTLVGLGDDAAITGGGLDVDGAHNVIIRNITFRDWDDDAINLQNGSTNVWIDHNTFSDGYDGVVDIKRESDYVTLSWNHVHDHDKTMLLGHDDGHTADLGNLRVTYHHNWFEGTTQRHPRVRFGDPVHVFNNYYSGNEYGVASTMDAGVLVEGNYFENVDAPTRIGMDDSAPGDLVARNNHFVNSGAPEAAGDVAPIPYTYVLDPAAEVRDIVTAGAGAGTL